MIDNNPRLQRRQLLAGLAGALTLPALASSGALPQNQVATWDFTTDVLVIGSGAAGLCAAIEARRAGARVLLIESLPQFGGVSAISQGVIYLGGGTALQRDLGVTDTAQDMYNFLSTGGVPPVSLEKIQLYCEQSAMHFDWLLAQGVPFRERLERAWTADVNAPPAPRGHLVGAGKTTAGRALMQALQATAAGVGVSFLARVAARQLVAGRDGRVVGAVLAMNDQRKTIRVRRGTVLSCGGFVHNRDMLRQYAPELYRCSAPWGSAGDTGDGINLGIAAGAAALQMHAGCAMLPGFPTEALLGGIIVNAAGQRFVSEDAYGGILGNAIAYHQQGRAWLITDSGSSFSSPQDDFPLAAEATTLGDLAVKVGFPQGALQHTVSYYNRFAEVARDPLFHKHGKHLRPVKGPPYQAWELSVDRAFFPVYTLGGLSTHSSGQVLNGEGEPIVGLFAAGRTTAGLPGAPYLANGLSLGDSTFFGRRAGIAAAAT